MVNRARGPPGHCSKPGRPAHTVSTQGCKPVHAVVRRGAIVEEGSHRGLVGIPDGAYATLVRLQQQRAAAGDQDADSLVRAPLGADATSR